MSLHLILKLYSSWYLLGIFQSNVACFNVDSPFLGVVTVGLVLAIGFSASLIAIITAFAA